MKIPLAAIGSPFRGVCLGGCGRELAAKAGADAEFACATTYCPDCTRRRNAERMAGVEIIPTRWTAESAAAFDATYLHATWADAMSLIPQPTKP